MRKILLALILVLGLCKLSSAKSVDSISAKAIAEAFLVQHVNQTNLKLRLVFQGDLVSPSSIPTTQSQENPLFYIFNSGNNNGFVIVAGDDNALPILGYSTSGTFDKDLLPPNFRKWLEDYKKEMDYIITNKILATDEIRDEWSSLTKGKTVSHKTSSAVLPLLTTTWNQSPFYNALCPGGSVTGCVATAMAQIMNYWEYPATGTGFHSYNEDNYGTLSANFGATNYQWSSMPNNVTSPNTAVATLMYHCGVSVDMDYSPTVSGAYVISAQSPVTHCSEYAFTTYFGYDNSVQGVKRANYTASAWKQLLKDELDAGRPIEYAGYGSGGGHAFVCDGYDNNDYFHFNWGWGGYNDGYFLIGALNPNGTGTGGGTGGYNSGHQAVIGIKPPTGVPTFNMKLYDYVTPSSSTLNYGQAFSITTNIWNDGSNNFSGDYCAAVFDNNANFIDYVEVKTGWSLNAGYIHTNGITFSTTGLLSMLPGTYHVGIYYRPTGGNWSYVSDYNLFTNFIQVNVTNSNAIELNSSLNLNPGFTFTQGQPASVNLNILNNGSSTFYGTYSADLYALDGSWVEGIGTITESNGLPAGYTYASPYLTFSTTSINANPGTYYLAMTHLPSGGGWELTGSSFYQNPIVINVEAPSILPDNYEPNNSGTTAYNLTANFLGNNSSVSTIGSNSHTGSDYDFYKINLPSGYNYTITARVHDSYNSGNGNPYTNDVLWSYSTGGAWSNAYDDVMPSNISVSNGGTITFHVAPYFQGQTGTYLLDIQISRTASIGKEEDVLSSDWTIFPNPTNEFINLANDKEWLIDNILITDIAGKVIVNHHYHSNDDQITIPVQNMTTGTYFIIVQSDEKIWRHKFVKTE